LLESFVMSNQPLSPRNFDGFATGSSWFLIAVALYITMLITANTVAVRVLDIGPFTADAGTLTFPITYIVGDVLTEVYGYRIARRVIWLGFLCNLMAVAIFQMAVRLPSVDDPAFQDAFVMIFNATPRILLASMAAYLVGSFINAFVMARMKVLTEGKWLWTRTIGSTLAGQGLDTVVFVFIAFWGVFPGEVIWAMLYTNWIVKIGIEVLATPVTYRVVDAFKKHERLDVYDTTTDFNPIAMSR
jgi:queuosine precursor transporter